MSLRWFVLAMCAVGAGLGAIAGSAQTAPQTADEALQAMVQAAGVIFTGQVTAVLQHPGSNGATGVVEIDFAVEDAVRGVTGGSYALREWAGLWMAADTPFLVGQRYLMLLYAPSAAGLSSPVDGMDGAIPIHGAGPGVTLGAASVTGFTVAGAPVFTDGRVVDLRWVQTHVAQTVTYRPEPVARPVGTTSGVQANVRATYPAEDVQGSAGRSAEMLSAGPSAVPNEASAQQAVPYATVLEKLRSWTKERDARR